MHLNYHFFKFLCPELQQLFEGMQVVECFSQNKDELIIGLSDGEKEHFIRSNLAPSNTCLSFPNEFKRSKKNNVSLFSDILHEKVSKIQVLDFERAFTIRFVSGKIILFKMHGTRSNILFFPEEDSLPLTLFRNELKEDAAIKINQLRNPIVPNWERFVHLEGNASLFLPTLGKVPRQWLKAHGYLNATLQEKWQLIKTVMDMLDSPLFSIRKEKEGYQFTLLPSEDKLFSSDNPVEAANEFFRYAVVYQSLEKERNALLKNLEDKKKKTQAYLNKTAGKLYELEHQSAPNKLADIIMANLHQIPMSAEKVTLFDFYNDQEIDVAIKKGVSPQKHAENLYRKGKNRKIEIKQLQKNLQEKENYLLDIETHLEEVGEISNFKELKAFIKENNLISQQKGQQENIPFKRFEIDGFELLIGKSAKANDELLRHYSWKEDLWLHAKDVSGSHAILKYKAGLTFPVPTIERAAELAAYYSKNKNESLATVIYTPCKFIRKVKGSAPGAVTVDKESVIMVSPKGPRVV
ncbi:MAG: NFACT RNA binding domain-containing protein [Anditalea sp.]